MNFNRIRPTIDVERMQQSHVTMVGGAFGLMNDLVRCGLGSLSICDFDHVSASNPARQDFDSRAIGLQKVTVAAEMFRRTNQDSLVETFARDFCSFTPEEIDEHFGHTDLFIFAADFFPAQARGNLEAVRLGKPALFIGLYRGGRAGEVILFLPGSACLRCSAPERYAAFGSGGANVTSAGGTVFDMRLTDAVAGHLALGALTRGADNRAGRIIDQLGDRRLLQIKIDPQYRLGDRDIFGEYLGDHPANFSFTTIALARHRSNDCPDCRSAAVLPESTHPTTESRTLATMTQGATPCAKSSAES